MESGSVMTISEPRNLPRRVVFSRTALGAAARSCPVLPWRIRRPRRHLPGMTLIEKTRLSDDDPILTLSHVLSPEECDRCIRAAEGVGFAEAPITVGPNRFLMAPEIRNNRRVMVDDPALSAWLWARIEGLVPAAVGDWYAVGLNERLRTYRYEPGQHFDWHRDGAFVRSSEERSLLTVLFYLNDDFLGGSTDFTTQGGELQVTPRRGMALLFDHPLCHRGAPVLRGTKYVLRTDVMYALA
jgi:prolyl 4-hydroxylase